MAIKDFSFKGKTLEDLKKLPHQELMNLFDSRIRRKMKRGFTDTEKTLIEKAKNANEKSFIKTHCRDMVVLPDFVGKKFGIYNGKEWTSVIIAEDMIGHRLGEFALTRRSVKHSAAGIGATRGSSVAAKK